MAEHRARHTVRVLARLGLKEASRASGRGRPQSGGAAEEAPERQRARPSGVHWSSSVHRPVADTGTDERVIPSGLTALLLGTVFLLNGCALSTPPPDPGAVPQAPPPEPFRPTTGAPPSALPTH